MLWSAVGRFLRDTVVSPAGLISAFSVWLKERKAERDALRNRGTVAGDLGAEVSIRELGTARHLGSYIRRLDVEKYNKILDRAVLEAVQDFLASKGVDISAFSSSALNIINGDVIGVTGNGNQVGGHQSVFNPRATTSRSR